MGDGRSPASLPLGKATREPDDERQERGVTGETESGLGTYPVQRASEFLRADA